MDHETPDERFARLGRFASPRVELAIEETLMGSLNVPDDDKKNALAAELVKLMVGHDANTVAMAMASAANHHLQHEPAALAHLIEFLVMVLDCELGAGQPPESAIRALLRSKSS